MVSGAASGMGRQMALGFAEAGADIVLADINMAGAKITADEIESIGRRAVAVECNVSDIEQVRSLYKTIDNEFGRIDIVGNVAGEGYIGPPGRATCREASGSFAEPCCGEIHLMPRSRSSDARAGQRFHHQFRIDRWLEFFGSRTHTLRNGDGCWDSDDP